MPSPLIPLSDSQLADSRQLGVLLLEVENRIALLSRCLPHNAVSERSRLIEQLERGRRPEPNWSYQKSPALDPALRLLARLQRQLPERIPLSRLWVQRVEQLHLEAQLAQAVGQPRFAPLARRRFPPAKGATGSAAASLAKDWSELDQPEQLQPLVRTDDTRDPRSLQCTLEAELARLRLPCRLATSVTLQSLAATGQGVIIIAADRWLTPSTARRIAMHEIHGHAIPRARARQQTHGIMLIGAAGCNEAEEGRALLIEQRTGLLDVQRRRELALRHQLALAGMAGQTWLEAVLQARGVVASWQQAVDIASRSYRGGGLFRESCYLIAFQRLQGALEKTPHWDCWLSAGRLTIESALELREAGIAIAKSDYDSGSVSLSVSTGRATSEENPSAPEQ